MRSAK